MPRPADEYPYFDNHGLPLAFAHRGGGLGDGTTLENSMAAFQAAIDLGFRHIETDVQGTRDGVAVIFHDSSVDRTTDGKGAIRDFTWKDLSSIKLGGIEAIARLDDVLDTWPDLRLNIDAKSPASVPLLADAVIRHRAFDRVCLAAFSHRSVMELRRRVGPRVATSFGRVEIGVLRLLPGGWLRSRLVGPAQVTQVPVRRGPLEIVTPGFIRRMHEHGKQVHVWTIDETDEINRLLDLGVDGIFSDRIDVLKAAYVARGIWRG
jgi:glycerophosphoryl diester phosphodiesterase